MSDHLETYIEPDLEARIVAMILGEASAFETEELKRLIETRSELKLFFDRMEAVHKLLRETGRGELEADDDWTLPEEKRAALLDAFNGSAEEKVIPIRESRPRRSRLLWGGAVAAAVITLAVLSPSRYSAIRYGKGERDQNGDTSLLAHRNSRDGYAGVEDGRKKMPPKREYFDDFGISEDGIIVAGSGRKTVETGEPAGTVQFGAGFSSIDGLTHFIDPASGPLGGRPDKPMDLAMIDRTATGPTKVEIDSNGPVSVEENVELGVAGEVAKSGSVRNRENKKLYFDLDKEGSIDLDGEEFRTFTESQKSSTRDSKPASESAGRFAESGVNFSFPPGGSGSDLSELSRRGGLDLFLHGNSERYDREVGADGVVARGFNENGKVSGYENGDKKEGEKSRELTVSTGGFLSGPLAPDDYDSSGELFIPGSDKKVNRPVIPSEKSESLTGLKDSDDALSFGFSTRRIEEDPAPASRRSRITNGAWYGEFSEKEVEFEEENIHDQKGGMVFGGGEAWWEDLGGSRNGQSDVRGITGFAAIEDNEKRVTRGESGANPAESPGTAITKRRWNQFRPDEERSVNGIMTERIDAIDVGKSEVLAGTRLGIEIKNGESSFDREIGQPGTFLYDMPEGPQTGKPSGTSSLRSGVRYSRGKVSEGREEDAKKVIRELESTLANTTKGLKTQESHLNLGDELKNEPEDEPDINEREGTHWKSAVELRELEELERKYGLDESGELGGIRNRLGEVKANGRKIAELQKKIEETELDILKREAEVLGVEIRNNELESVASELTALRKDQDAGIIRGEFESKIAKTYEHWGGAVVEGGNDQGVVPDAQMDVYRDGKLLGKLLVTEVEKNHSVAEVIPGTLQAGQSILPGDVVVKTGTTVVEKAPTAEKRKTAPLVGLKEKAASDEAFSTFSLHVSDVSFRLAYAALSKGEWPDPARIRIEEFVNAFDYEDPIPSREERVSSSIEQAIHPTMQQRNLLRIAMRTAESGRNSSTPLNLTFLIDSSGSMERFDRQDTLQRAFSLLADQLHEGDIVTLISFARQPRLLAEAVPGQKAGGLVNLVSHLPEEGGTNLESALKLALEKATEHRRENSQNRIILLTDGAANLGDANPERLAGIVTKMRETGIAFDAAGIGAEGLNDEILEALTRKGDGRYYLLDRPEDADSKFASQIAGALRPAAMNVKVQVEFNPLRVGRYQLHGFEKHRLEKEDFRNDKVDAAEMSAAEAGVALYHFEPLPGGTGEVGSVSVRFRDMSTGRMVEKCWPIPYQPSLPRLRDASETVRLATIATLTGSKLKGEPLGSRSEWDELSELLGSLSSETRQRERVKQLSEMIEKARLLK